MLPPGLRAGNVVLEVLILPADKLPVPGLMELLVPLSDSVPAGPPSVLLPTLALGADVVVGVVARTPVSPVLPVVLPTAGAVVDVELLPLAPDAVDVVEPLLLADALDPPSPDGSACATAEPLASAAPTPSVSAPAPSHFDASLWRCRECRRTF